MAAKYEGRFIKDKVIVRGKNGEPLHCPPHYFPHKLPFAEPVTDEPCHFHKCRLNMMHHALFCKLINCPHYERMIQEYKKYRKGTWD